MLTDRSLFLAKNVVHYTIALMFRHARIARYEYVMNRGRGRFNSTGEIRQPGDFAEFRGAFPHFPWFCTRSIPTGEVRLTRPTRSEHSQLCE